MLSGIVGKMQRGNQILKHADVGAILMEFAFVIPMLIAIVYYFHDIPRYRRMQTKMELCNHCAVSLIQNISQGRESKAITKKDIAYINAISMLPYWGKEGINQYNENGALFPGYYSYPMIYYVKGTGENKAKIIWVVDGGYGTALPGQTGVSVFKSSPPAWLSIKATLNKEYNTDSILPGLKIKNDEVKIIYEAIMWSNQSFKKRKKPTWANGKPLPFTFDLYVMIPSESVKYSTYYTLLKTLTVFVP
ncbi:MAG: hypothetical protein LBJ71_03890, partial [Holosporaceae bacterium]|nr:hypothetical protein [Holosporaceae bacterium]